VGVLVVFEPTFIAALFHDLLIPLSVLHLLPHHPLAHSGFFSVS